MTGSRGSLATRWALTVIVVVGLVIQAVVHIDLAPDFAHNRTSVLTEQGLFYAEAIAAILAAFAVLVRPRRYTVGFAFLVAAAGTVAVIVYRYADMGSIGPIPGMYDPYWTPVGKSISVIAELVAALAALALFVMLSTESRRHGAAGTTE